jgi:hypothetical protein
VEKISGRFAQYGSSYHRTDRDGENPRIPIGDIMNPDIVLAMTIMAERNRAHSHPLAGHRYEADRQRRQANRARRDGMVGRIGAAIRPVVGGRRVRGLEPATSA